MRSAILGCQIAFALVVALARTAESAALYHLTDLAGPTFTQSLTAGINNSGQVIGDAYVNGMSSGNPFLYSNGTYTFLPSLGGNGGVGSAINATGQIVGASEISGNSTFHAYLYSGGVLTDLGEPFGGNQVAAYAINDSGQIAGSASLTGNMASHAFRYSNGVIQDLGTLGGNTSIGYGINATGDVIGQSDITGSGEQHAFIFKNNVMTDLGTLGGPNSYAYAINASGQVAGTAEISPFSSAYNHAVIYSGGTITDLGTLGNKNSYAYGINSEGQVVGNSEPPTAFGLRAFLYTDHVMYDLTNLLDSSGAGWNLSNAVAINDNGWIAAYGYPSSGSPQHGVLLTPVTPQLVRGDFNQDGHVTAADVSAMVKALTDLNAYKLKNGLFDANLNTIGDFNNDGTVTNADLQMLLNLLKSGGGSVDAVPEPQSLGLVAAACVVCLGVALHRKRREPVWFGSQRGL